MKELMEECSSFLTCDAPLCPLDKDVDLRIWYPDEPICKGHYAKGVRWIRKQRSIIRNQTKSWLNGNYITKKQLEDASKPKKISMEQMERLRRFKLPPKTTL